MIQLFQFIYFQTNLFYKERLKVKKHELFTISLISFLLTFNISTIVISLCLIFNLNFHGMLFPLVGGVCILVFIIFFNSGYRNKMILEKGEILSKQKNSVFKKWAIIYISISLVLFYSTYFLYYKQFFWSID
jgi:hypothetical protein